VRKRRGRNQSVFENARLGLSVMLQTSLPSDSSFHMHQTEHRHTALASMRKIDTMLIQRPNRAVSLILPSAIITYQSNQLMSEVAFPKPSFKQETQPGYFQRKNSGNKNRSSKQCQVLAKMWVARFCIRPFIKFTSGSLSLPNTSP
jgi:hypothetical protein